VMGCQCWSWCSAAAWRATAEDRFALFVPGRGRPSRCGQLAGTAVLAGVVGGWAAGGAALDHGDRDKEGAGRDGGHDPAPGVRLCLGEAGGQAQSHPTREYRRGP
jgi:hypothetical protein